MDFKALVKHIQHDTKHVAGASRTRCKPRPDCPQLAQGGYIVEFEQNGEDRAAYGEQLLGRNWNSG